MNIIKKYQFWICAVLSVIFFVVIYPLSVSPYTGAYYILVFNAISIMGFAFALYFSLTKSFTKKKAVQLIWIISISSLPHLALALLSYGSWVCLCSAIIIILMLILNKRKFPEQ